MAGNRASEEREKKNVLGGWGGGEEKEKKSKAGKGKTTEKNVRQGGNEGRRRGKRGTHVAQGRAEGRREGWGAPGFAQGALSVCQVPASRPKKKGRKQKKERGDGACVCARQT